MSDINIKTGELVRKYRKSCKMTLQQLADAIHKSRATVCKYENGEISVDLETLFEISQVLQVSLPRLADYRSNDGEEETVSVENIGKSPFFKAKRLYFYFYDGRYNRLKDGIINIYDKSENGTTYDATFSLCSVSGNGRSGEAYYTGTVLYSDMLIRFSFVNTLNPLEEDLLYIFNPLERRDYTDGLLCGISSVDFMPCAFRCLVTLTPQPLDENLRKKLLFSSKEIQRWAKLNMLTVDNRNE